MNQKPSERIKEKIDRFYKEDPTYGVPLTSLKAVIEYLDEEWEKQIKKKV